jgi:hypothetical protein
MMAEYCREVERVMTEMDVALWTVARTYNMNA